MYTLMEFFWETISALRGCCALKFLQTLEIDKGLLAHTPFGCVLVSLWRSLAYQKHIKKQKKQKHIKSISQNRENLKFALKFSVLESITSGIVQIFSLNFFMRPAIIARRISSSWNWFCTRTCGAGRPHVWLCHARLVIFWTYPSVKAL